MGQFALGIPPGIPALLQSTVRLEGIKPDTAAELMVNVRVAVPVPPPLVALSVTADVPVAVGVPEINPVAVLIESPAGSPLAP
jgi:hypothetical protein